MATATHERPESPLTITLVLTEEEALFVHGALRLTKPNPTSRYCDPVWNVLGAALADAGVWTGDSLKYAEPLLDA